MQEVIEQDLRAHASMRAGKGWVDEPVPVHVEGPGQEQEGKPSTSTQRAEKKSAANDVDQSMKDANI